MMAQAEAVFKILEATLYATVFIAVIGFLFLIGLGPILAVAVHSPT